MGAFLFKRVSICMTPLPTHTQFVGVWINRLITFTYLASNDQRVSVLLWISHARARYNKRTVHEQSPPTPHSRAAECRTRWHATGLSIALRSPYDHSFIGINYSSIFLFQNVSDASSQLQQKYPIVYRRPFEFITACVWVLTKIIMN